MTAMPSDNRPSRPQAALAAPAPCPLLTTEEAAQFLHCSSNFLRDDRRGARVVPFIKLGAKAVRYRIADVEKALDQMVMGAKR